jgi:hypothetical protein
VCNIFLFNLCFKRFHFSKCLANSRDADGNACKISVTGVRPYRQAIVKYLLQLSDRIARLKYPLKLSERIVRL